MFFFSFFHFFIFYFFISYLCTWCRRRGNLGLTFDTARSAGPEIPEGKGGDIDTVECVHIDEAVADVQKLFINFHILISTVIGRRFAPKLVLHRENW